MPVEEPANARKLRLVEMEHASVPLDDGDSAQPSDPVTGGVADDSAERRSGDDPPDRQMAQRGQGSGGYQYCLARERNSETLDGHEQKNNCSQAVN